jgi:hypothetical protein
LISSITAVLTDSRSVTGRFDHGDRRLSDVLNSGLESVLHLSDAVLGRLGNRAASEPVQNAVVTKSHVLLVQGHGEAPPPLTRLYSFVERQPSELLLLVGGLRVRGLAHASSEFDPVNLHRLLTEAGDKFVPVTGATMALDVEGTKSVDLGVALINVRHIQFVARLASPAGGERIPAGAGSSVR